MNTRKGTAAPSGSRGAKQGTGMGRAVKGKSRVGNQADVTDKSPDICGFCTSVTMSDAIGCDKCPQWFHPTVQCTGLKLPTIKCIQDEGGDAVRFVCCSCRCKPSNNDSLTSSNSMSSDNIAVSQLFETVKSLAASVIELRNQVSDLTNQISSQAQRNYSDNPSNSFSRNDLYSEIREYEERKKRKDSLIVRGTSAKSDAEFAGIFSNIATRVLDKRVIASVSDVYCIKKDTSLYRINVSDSAIRQEILTKCKTLKNDPNYKTVYISRDLTYSQRMEMRKRRLEQAQQNGGTSNADATIIQSVPDQGAPSHGDPNAPDNSGVGSQNF